MDAAAKEIVVSGSSGLVGSALVTRLAAVGHRVTRLVRRPALAGEIRWDPPPGELPAAELEGVDAVINLAGAGIGDKRWTDARTAEIVESRTRSTDLLARTAAAVDHRPAVLLSGSAVGIYGGRGDEEPEETAALGNGFLAGLDKAWEAATEPASAAAAGVAGPVNLTAPAPVTNAGFTVVLGRALRQRLGR